MSSQRINRKLSRAVPWAIAESLFSLGHGVLSIVVIGMLVSPDELGLAGAALATAAIIELMFSGGMQDTVIRTRSSDTTSTDTAFTISIGWALAGVVACFLAALVVAHIYGNPLLFPMIVFASLIGAANTLSAVPTAMLIRKMRAAALTRRMMLGKVAGIVALSLFALTGYGAWAVVLGSIVAALTMAISVMISAARLPRPRFRRTKAREFFVFGFAVGLENLIWGLTTRSFILLFGFFHGVNALGYFQFAMKLVDETANLIQTAANRFGLAYFSAIRRDAIELLSSFAIGTKLVCSVAFPVLLMLAILGSDVVSGLFPAQWDAAGPYIQIVAIGWLFVFPRLFITPIMRSAGYQKRLVSNASVTLIVALAMLTALSWLDPLWGAVAWAARQAYSLGWFVLQVFWTEGFSPRKQAANLIRILIAAAIFSGILLGAPQLVPWIDPNLLFTALIAIMGLILYIIFLLCLEPQIRSLVLPKNIADKVSFKKRWRKK